MIEEVRKACNHLKNGKTILYPTDTIWGIGCDATNNKAVSSIYKIKQRTDSKNMLILLDNPGRLTSYIREIPEVAWDLIEATDTPMTIIYPGAKNLAPQLIAGDGSIGIRITSDPFCVRLIQQFGKPIVSTSANISGTEPPSLFEEIEDEIRDHIDYVVDWRRYESASIAPSSIIKLDESGRITILRP